MRVSFARYIDTGKRQIFHFQAEILVADPIVYRNFVRCFFAVRPFELVSFRGSGCTYIRQ